jgi:Mrp family chromosome partitioning ATPase/capsular polysaccharide biosynthesis protein
MTTTDQPSRQRTLADYLAIIRRRKLVVVVLLLLAPSVAYLSSSQQPAVYAASSEVLLRPSRSALSGFTNEDINTEADRFAETQAALARVPEVARRALEKARVKAMRPGELLANSNVSPRGNADLLRFTVNYADPVVAAQLATAYAQAFSEYRVELDTADLANARKDLQRGIAALERERATGTPLYRELTRKAQDLRTMELLQRKPNVVRSPALGSQIAPTPRRSVMLGAAIGLLLGLAAALLAEALDKRVRDEDEIQRTLGIPLLARLPAPHQRSVGSDWLAMIDDPSGVDAEAIRRLRSNVELANLDVDAKVIMVTSAVGVEGKSLTVANLAVALARSGYRVALVDLDLRKPSIGRLFGLGPRPGVTDVAIEKIHLERALAPARLDSSEPIPLSSRSAGGSVTGEGPAPRRSEQHGELFLLPAGFLPTNPGELVGTHAVAGILSRLKEQMDFVLVDVPPMLAASDAVTLSTRVDAIAVVVRLGVVNRTILHELSRELETSSAQKLGFILTGTESPKLHRGYEYGYTDGSEAPPGLRPMEEAELVSRSNRRRRTSG